MSETNVDHIRVYQDHAGAYRWAAIAGNGALGTGISVVIDATTDVKDNQA